MGGWGKEEKVECCRKALRGGAFFFVSNHEIPLKYSLNGFAQVVSFFFLFFFSMQIAVVTTEICQRLEKYVFLLAFKCNVC